MQAAYIAMDLTCWFVILPLSLVSPVTGVMQSLGTAWGLFRHYWIVVKFAVTIPCTVILIVHMVPTGKLAAAAAHGALEGGALSGLRMQLIGDSAAAVFVLLVMTGLSMYKPRGLTAIGVARARTQAARAIGRPNWITMLRWTVLVLGVALVAAHLTGNGTIHGQQMISQGDLAASAARVSALARRHDRMASRAAPLPEGHAHRDRMAVI